MQLYCYPDKKKRARVHKGGSVTHGKARGQRETRGCGYMFGCRVLLVHSLEENSDVQNTNSEAHPTLSARFRVVWPRFSGMNKNVPAFLRARNELRVNRAPLS